jgi:hypothetical protein
MGQNDGSTWEGKMRNDVMKRYRGKIKENKGNSEAGGVDDNFDGEKEQWLCKFSNDPSHSQIGAFLFFGTLGRSEMTFAYFQGQSQPHCGIGAPRQGDMRIGIPLAASRVQAPC